MEGEKIRVWTKQHENVWKILQEKGRFIQQKRYVAGDLGDQAGIMREAYDWLAKNSPDVKNKPADVEYPVWVSFKKETTMLKEPSEEGSFFCARKPPGVLRRSSFPNIIKKSIYNKKECTG